MRLTGADTVPRHHDVEGLGADVDAHPLKRGIDQAPPGSRHQSGRNRCTSAGSQEVHGSGLPSRALRSNPGLHGHKQLLSDFLGPRLRTDALGHVARDAFERPSKAVGVIRCAPGAPPRGHDLVLRFPPHRLAIDQRAVKVDQDAGRCVGAIHHEGGA